ncbi:MAG: hypothetical protein SVY41_03345 [Candidatus Nanohaloarchaea archaeon]|nr:hypothetical protein [Candidatus Nanohaloarchaea archaeon]
MPVDIESLASARQHLSQQWPDQSSGYVPDRVFESAMLAVEGDGFNRSLFIRRSNAYAQNNGQAYIAFPKTRGEFVILPSETDGAYIARERAGYDEEDLLLFEEDADNVHLAQPAAEIVGTLEAETVSHLTDHIVQGAGDVRGVVALSMFYRDAEDVPASDIDQHLSDIAPYTPTELEAEIDFHEKTGSNGYPSEVREEVLNQAQACRQDGLSREQTVEQLQEEYDIPEGTLLTWFFNTSLRWEKSYPDQFRSSIVDTARQFKSAGFNRKNTFSILSTVYDVPEGTLDHWMEGEVRFGGRKYTSEQEETVVARARTYKDDGLNRTETIEQIAEDFPDITGGTIDNWLSEEGLEWGWSGHGADVRTRILNRAQDLREQGVGRRETARRLAEEFDGHGVPAGTINNWFSEEDMSWSG